MTLITRGAPAIDPALRVTRAVVAALAVVQLALYLVLALRTWNYPFPLEWMEGGTVDVIRRLVHGLPMYVQPRAEYVPYIYPPFYYWTSAQLARVVGIDFLAPRLVSLASIGAVFVLIGAIIRRNGGSLIASLAGAALFAGTYESTERWFHVARVDSLFLALLLAAVYVLQSGTKWRSAVAAGILLFLAFLTKQTTLIAAVPLLFIAGIQAPKRPLITAAVFGVLVEATNVIMDARTGGWWSYFLYRLPLLHGPAVHGSYWFWRYDVVPVMPLALAVAAVLLGGALVARAFEWRWIAALCVAGIGASWAARLHSGGAANSLMPAYAALAIAMPIAIDAFTTRPAWRLAGSVLLALQLALLLHTWTGAMPTAEDRAAGMRYVDFLRHTEGEVLVWHQRFVETRAGKQSWGLEMAAEDLMRANDPATRDAFAADVIRVCRSGRVAGVVDPPDWLQAAIAFGPPVSLFSDTKVFRPVAGAPKRPERYFPILQRHQADEPGHRDQVDADAQHAKRPAPER
jgi:hypothetical protein